MPTSFSHIVLCLSTFPLLLLQSLQNTKNITFAVFTLLPLSPLSYYFATKHFAADTKFPGVVELTTQLLILEYILWLPLCRINKFGFNTLPYNNLFVCSPLLVTLEWLFVACWGINLGSWIFQVLHNDKKIYIPSDSKNRAMLPGNGARKRSWTYKYRGSQQFSRVEYWTQIYWFDTRGAKEYLQVLAAKLSIQPHLEINYL